MLSPELKVLSLEWKSEWMDDETVIPRFVKLSSRLKIYENADREYLIIIEFVYRIL